jgi:proteasome accessory factor PafA2
MSEQRPSAVARIMGVETEYGISVPGQATANPMVASTLIVNAYAQLGLPGASGVARRMRWDFIEEHPTRDARGFDAVDMVLGTGDAPANDEELGLANLVLTNGARLYVDHAHPEYSAPECTGPRDATLWDKAGERVMQRAADQAAHLGHPPTSVLLYKNNTDNKGASYGTHENFLVHRATPFAELVRWLTPFFVTRQVFAGSGRVGIGQDGREHGFQLSQRADFFEVEVGLETTLKRPIINTRDEPHADPERWRRLHVIVGDANLCEVATWLKLGTTSLVLSLVESGWLADSGLDLGVEAPVTAMHQVSHDTSLRHLLTLRDGRRLTAVQLQREYHDQARKFVDDRFGVDADLETRDVLERWGHVLDTLEADPMALSGQLDWVAKLRLMQGYREREGLDWSAPKLHLVDLQYSDLRPERGLYARLAATGRVERLFSEAEIVRAVDEPPEDTRAWFRGKAVGKFTASIAAASWDSIVLDTGGDNLQRVPTLDPLRGTKAHVGALLDRCDTAADLLEALQGG